MFVYQPTFSTIKYQDINTEDVIGWKSKEVYVTDLVPIKIDSLPDIKYSKHGIGIQFKYIPLVAGQINYTTKIALFMIIDQEIL